jgi:hypothetical protein
MEKKKNFLDLKQKSKSEFSIQNIETYDLNVEHYSNNSEYIGETPDYEITNIIINKETTIPIKKKR